MDLGAGQRRVVFVVVVGVLAALGCVLLVPALGRPGGPARAAAPPRAAAPAGPAAPSGPPSSPASGPASGAGGGAGGVDIYAWLPFTRQDLAAAAAVTVRFCVDYDTFSYTQDGAAYVAAMGDLVTGPLAAALQAAYQAPGVARLRAARKQVSAGTAVIDSLRAFGPSSLTFVVTAGQRLVTAAGATASRTQYAVTVTGAGASWQVSDIELASAGN